MTTPGGYPRKQRTARLAANRETAPQGKFIREKAIELFSERGYSASTMDDLSDRTGLNKATLYYYYETKAQILYDICSATIDSALETLAPLRSARNPAQAFGAFIDAYLDWLSANVAQAQVIGQERSYRTDILPAEQVESLIARERELTNSVAEAVRKGIESGQFVDCNVTFVAGSIITVLNATATWKALQTERAGVATAVKTLLLGGLLTR